MAKKKSKLTTAHTVFSIPERRKIYDTIDDALVHNMKLTVLVQVLISNHSAMTEPRARAMVHSRKRMNAKTTSGLLDDSDINRGMYILRMESVYGLAMERGDFKGAAMAAKELAAVQGVLPTGASSTRTVVNQKNQNNFLSLPQGSVNQLHELSDAQLKLGLDKREVSVEQAKLLVDQSRGVYRDDSDEPEGED